MNDIKKTSPDFINHIWNNIPQNNKICFFSSFVIGILVHFFMISNKITNLDDIVCVPGVGVGKDLGRWFQIPVHNLFSPWSSPALNGIMAIFFLSIAACVIVNSLKVESITGAVLIGIIIMTIPSTASNMYFMYLAPTFALSILATTVNVYITMKYKYGWIFGAILQLFSMACYQAYFGLSTSLFVLICLLMLIDGEEVGFVVKKGLISILCLGVSMACYLFSLRFVDLIDYKGLNDIGQSSAITIIHAFLRAYHRVLQYFITKPESFMVGAPILFNRLLVIILLLLIITLFIQKKIYSEPLRCILSFILLAIMPLSLGLVYVMAPEISHASTVMIFSYSVFYFFIIVEMERILTINIGKKIVTVFASLITITLLLESYSCARVVNNAYYRSYVAQNRVMHYYNRILSKLESTEGYHYGDQLTILGGFYPNPVPVATLNMNGQELADLEGAALEDHLFLWTNREDFLKIWFGIDTGTITPEEQAEIMETDEFKNMPIFPADGCVAQINGIWVVKMNEDDSK